MGMQTKVLDEIRSYIGKAETLYNMKFEMPNVTFDVRGRVAGKANYYDWSVKFNNVLLTENFDKFLATTVPHEVAHLIAYKVAIRDGYYRIKPHGNEWKAAMRGFGLTPKRCHTYDTTNASTRRSSRSTRLRYSCGRCGGSISVGPTQHRRILAGTVYRSRCCGAVVSRETIANQELIAA